MNAVDNEGNPALTLVVNSGQTESIKVLLAAGADVNLKNHAGITPLMIAARKGSYEMSELLQLLREAGAVK